MTYACTVWIMQAHTYTHKQRDNQSVQCFTQTPTIVGTQFHARFRAVWWKKCFTKVKRRAYIYNMLSYHLIHSFYSWNYHHQNIRYTIYIIHIHLHTNTCKNANHRRCELLSDEWWKCILWTWLVLLQWKPWTSPFIISTKAVLNNLEKSKTRFETHWCLRLFQIDCHLS